MSRIIFYSWQNDLDKKTHRYFIEDCIKKALNKVENDALIYANYDRDTKGLNGSPDITSTIFDKIERSVLFVCDISIINANFECRKSPNPNVLIELGYAVHKLGWDRVICLFDINSGNIDDLPFDLRQKRITSFNPISKNERNRVSSIIAENIKNLYVKGKLFNPLDDYMKGRIDTSILNITKQMSNLVYGSISMSSGLANVKPLLECSNDDLKDRISSAKFPAFIVLNTFSSDTENLKNILQDLLSSSYFSKEWSFTVLKLIDWIRSYEYFISRRNKSFPFYEIKSAQYQHLACINAHSINPSNPVNSFLIIETYNKNGQRYVDTHSGKVVNSTQYPTDNAASLTKCLAVHDSSVETVLRKRQVFRDLYSIRLTSR